MPTASFPTTISSRVSRIVQNVLLHVPGVLDNILRMEYYNTLDEFLKDTNIWTNDILFSTVANTATYAVTPSDGIINRLMQIVNSSKNPVSVTMPVPGSIVFNNAPTTADTITATVALTCIDPTDTNDYPIVDDWILDKYGNYLQDGIIGKLTMQPAKPYTNQQLSVYHTRRFRNGVALGISEGRRKLLYDAQRWQFPNSFSVRRKKM